MTIDTLNFNPDSKVKLLKLHVEINGKAEKQMPKWIIVKRRKEAEMKWSQSRRERKWIDTREGVQDRIQEGKQKMLEGSSTQDFLTEFSFFLPDPPHQHLPPKRGRDCERGP